MVYDHGLGYSNNGFRAKLSKFPLLAFLSGNSMVKNVEFILRREVKDFSNKSFVDVGCSTGYVTSVIVELFKPSIAYGLDINKPSLELAKQRYPNIQFMIIDLNCLNTFEYQYDIVTCSETLEHVGELNIAIANLLAMKKDDGCLVIVVPNEIGSIGFLRVLWRVARYGYNAPNCFRELSPTKHLFLKYILSLLTGEKISKYRSNQSHWCTHFGFDYRDVDDYLNSCEIKFKAFNKDGYRFYRI